MFRQYLFWRVGFIAFLFLIVLTAFTLNRTPQKSVEEQFDNETNIDQIGTVCELGKTYERNSNHKYGCVCPENYVFDTTIVGFNACAGEGSECPMLEVICVPEDQEDVL